MNRRTTRTNDTVGRWDALIACAQQRLRRNSQDVAKLRALLSLLQARRGLIAAPTADLARRKLSR